MNDSSKGFVGYEYMEAPVQRSMEALYADGYQNFGWQLEGTSEPKERPGQVDLKLKRDRKLRCKAGLTRLQRQFESCAHEVEALERSKTRTASIAAYVIGLIGTTLLSMATFAYLADKLPVMIACAVPGFLLWILPYFCYQKLKWDKTAQVTPIIDQKQDEIYSVCEQASRLLQA